MPWTPLTTHTSGSSHYRCAKRTFHTLQTPTSWIAGTPAAKLKRCHLRHKAVQWVEAPTANGQDQDHHLSRGKMATEDMAHKTGVHQALIEDQEAMTDDRHNTTTEAPQVHLGSEDLTGEMVSTRAIVLCLRRHLTVDIHYHRFPDTDQEMTVAGHHQQVATRTYPAMAPAKARDDPVSPTSDPRGKDPVTLEIRAKALQTTGRIEVERTATGLAM